MYKFLGHLIYSTYEIQIIILSVKLFCENYKHNTHIMITATTTVVVIVLALKELANWYWPRLCWLPIGFGGCIDSDTTLFGLVKT